MKTFRQKGLQFEITVSKILSSWLNKELETNDLHFWRTHGSGSVASKIKNLSPEFFSGDITPLTEVSKKYFQNVLTECKNVELDNSFLRNSIFPTVLEEYITKLYTQAKQQSKKYGLLFVKRNRGKIWFVVVVEKDNIIISSLSKYFDVKITERRKEYVILITDLNQLVDEYKFTEVFSNFI